MLIYYTEDDVTGQDFLDLTENDIKSLAGKIGPIKRIMRLQKMVGWFYIFAHLTFS